MSWTHAIALNELTPGVPRAVVVNAHRIMLLSLDGALHATDLACPHEGYPLTQGSLEGTVVTCCRHEFRFDLRDGACLKGAETLRTWPTRVTNGSVLVDLSTDQETTRRRAQESLARATQAGRLGQGLRETVRFLHASGQAERLLGWLARDDGARAEWGITHVTPLAAELLPFLNGELEHDTQVVALPLQLQTERAARLPAHPVPPPQPMTQELWLAAVERRDVTAALAGLSPNTPLPWLYEAALRHLTDFGHGLIYVLAADDLSPWLPEPQALHAGLVRTLADGTREDSLPEWRRLRRFMEQHPPESHWPGVRDGQPADTTDLDAALIRGRGMLPVLQHHLEQGTAWSSIVASLARAASHRLLQFDTNIDADSTVAEGWLHVTHLLTCVDALARTADRHDSPTLLRAAMQTAWFIARAAPLDRTDGATPACEPLAADAALARLLNDRVPTAIIYAHLHKTLVTGHRLSARIGSEEPLIAASHFVRSSPRERNVARDVHIAVRLVRDGLTPQRRAP